MSYAQTPKKISVRIFFSPLGHLFCFLEMELLSLYQFFPTFRSAPAPFRACVIKNTLPHAPLRSSYHLCFLVGNVRTAFPYIYIISFFKMQMIPPLRSPPCFSHVYVLFLSFAFMIPYLHFCFGIFYFYFAEEAQSLCRGNITYTPYSQN